MDSNKVSTFGLETMKKLYECQLKRKEDAVVIVMHWILSKHGFRCIGLGDGREIAGDETQSELLPTHWNDDSTYLLRYMYSKQLYLLKITRTSNDVMINLIKADDMKIFSFMILESDINEEGLKGEITYIEKIDKNLISTFLEKPKPSTSSILRDNRFDSIYGERAPRPLPNFGEVGRRDLDPFGFGVGTGMLFNRPEGLDLRRPLHRFDPIHPEQGPRIRPPYGSDPFPEMPPHFM